MVYLRRATDQSGVDPETGLLDADGFQACLESDPIRAAFDERSVSLLTVTLPDLRKTKQTYGPDGARAAVLEIASRLHRCTRGGDILGRTADDTFRIIVVGADPAGTSRVMKGRAEAMLSETIWHHQRVVKCRTELSTTVTRDPGAVVRWVTQDREGRRPDTEKNNARKSALQAEAARQLALRSRLAAHSAGRKG